MENHVERHMHVPSDRSDTAIDELQSTFGRGLLAVWPMTPIDHEEVLNAICTLKNNMSSGADGITIEILKAGGDNTIGMFVNLC